MTFTVRFRREAVVDLEDASHWYEQQRQGLGARFLAAFESGISLIADNPRRFRELEPWNTSRSFDAVPVRNLLRS